jgi:hypothetical protein
VVKSNTYNNKINPVENSHVADGSALSIMDMLNHNTEQWTTNMLEECYA